MGDLVICRQIPPPPSQEPPPRLLATPDIPFHGFLPFLGPPLSAQTTQPHPPPTPTDGQGS